MLFNHCRLRFLTHHRVKQLIHPGNGAKEVPSRLHARERTAFVGYFEEGNSETIQRCTNTPR